MSKYRTGNYHLNFISKDDGVNISYNINYNKDGSCVFEAIEENQDTGECFEAVGKGRSLDEAYEDAMEQLDGLRLEADSEQESNDAKIDMVSVEDFDYMVEKYEVLLDDFESMSEEIDKLQKQYHRLKDFVKNVVVKNELDY